MQPIPGKKLLVALAVGALAALLALIAGLSIWDVASISGAALLLLVLLTCTDYVISRRAWGQSVVRMARGLPPAFAVGARRPVSLNFEVEGPHDWHGQVFDYPGGSFHFEGLPAPINLLTGKRLDIVYEVTPTRRGEAKFAPAQLRLRSRWGWCELLLRIGTEEIRRVYPDFAQIARYTWLAGDRRLQEIGIKTYQQRGEGTDFKQLAEYRYGDPVRHIDW
jgi:uncharacterized protein (DUF58 family)